MNVSPRTLAVAAVVSLVVAGCPSTPDEEAPVEEFVFEGQAELLPGLSFDTGLQPPGSPVQASLGLTAKGFIDVTAAAAASGSPNDPTLTGLRRSAVMAVTGAFALEGKLRVDITGLPKYDGSIPGLDDVDIAVDATTQYDPFALSTTVAVSIEIPPARLPAIPLPGGLPGRLVLEIAQGSLIEVALSGNEACIDTQEARYAVTVDRIGHLVIAPSIEIDIPLKGTEVFEIPKVDFDLGIGSSEFVMTHGIEAFGGKPADGDDVRVICSD